jgi:hypothetical protein
MRVGCAEVRTAVENLWNTGFVIGFQGFPRNRCGNLLFHVERFAIRMDRKNELGRPSLYSGGPRSKLGLGNHQGMFHVERQWDWDRGEAISSSDGAGAEAQRPG